ncbi:hypothetical protein ACEQ8H_008081 [Pleosporales sp. CAS-2024a]
MVSIGTITRASYLGVGIFLTILTAIAIAMRIAVSLRQHKTFLLEDSLSVAFYVFNKYQYERFFMPPDLGYFINSYQDWYRGSNYDGFLIVVLEGSCYPAVFATV